MSNQQALYKVDETTEDIFRLQRLVKGSVLTGSNQELDSFFGDLKSAIIIVDSEFKILYINNTATNLNIDKDFEANKGSLVIDFVKKILGKNALIYFYENLINRKELVLTEGFSLARIEKLYLNPISNDGFVIKILLDELYTVSAANLFRYFPAMPIGYFGFDLSTQKRIAIRFASDNFTMLFPFMDMERLVEEEDYFLNFIHQDDRIELVSKIHSLKKKNSLLTEFRIVNTEGEEHWYQIIASKFSEKTEKNFWLAYLEDIHEKKIASIEREKLVHETLDDERHRMSMELHDGLGQHLVALNLYLSSLSNEADKTISDTCKKLTVESIMMMKSMCYNLAPPDLDKGLLHALDVFFGKSNEHSKTITYHFNAQKVPLKNLSNEQSYNLFRIVQEFVTNAQKYADCSNIHCEINMRNQQTTLMVYDDGKGFDLNKIKGGFGLKNMHKRAKLADASIELSSKIGEGTLLVLEFKST
jgi:signal transduction histidine kinase